MWGNVCSKKDLPVPNRLAVCMCVVFQVARLSQVDLEAGDSRPQQRGSL